MGLIASGLFFYNSDILVVIMFLFLKYK